MKKTITHIYQLVTLMSLHTSVKVGKDIVSISFDGGALTPYKRNGSFATSDPDMIKAIESENAYGNQYKKIYPLDEDMAVIKAKEADKPIPPSKLESIPGIASGQKARAYMLAKYEELTNADLKTNEEILKIATEKGIKFPDWNI